MKIRWFLLAIIPFLFCHNATVAGPDGDVYLAVSHSIVENGTLNILPETLPLEVPTQITRTHHAPIHQNIGGVLFILPASLLAVGTHIGAIGIQGMPPRFYDIGYHEGLWLGCVTYLLAMLSCLMIYRVARLNHGKASVIAALLFCVFGGPLFLYTVFYPCNTNLPAAFLASLLLYTLHFSNKQNKFSWVLVGAVFGLGTFVRLEFAVWLVPLVWAVYSSDRPENNPWQEISKRIFWVGIGAMSFVLPGILIKQIIFGQMGNSYSIQMDLANLSKSYLMLFGARNGLFVFWPVLLIALLGYVVSLRKNSPIYHAMFVLLLFLSIICGTIIFWNGELGHSLGQRWFLVGFPCFVLFLSRLFDLSKRHFYWLLTVCVACTIWALFLWAAYGVKWPFPGDVSGFLMPVHVSRMFHVLATYFPMFCKQILLTAIFPKHVDLFWLWPLFSLVILAGLKLGSFIDPEKRFGFGLASIAMVALVTNMFLMRAGSRGEQAYQKVVAQNPQATFVARNYEVNFEILSSMVDSMAFFMELGDYEHARYKKDKALSFLSVEAPDQLDNFRKSCGALELRKELGWYRLFPEQVHFELLNWYQSALADKEKNRQPEGIGRRFLY
ncbi:MAG: glycosyltransferase family 39 protein [Geobacteraceae bacterium]|nr:glycosyltransferase family 39 protein [Geobacteraceae bacterium]